MMSISEFSEMCQLSPQTLRFYHAEDLLVPADVNEQTGYRYYRFEQVEQAMEITVLRNTGMSVELVRQALHDPETAPELLRQHRADVWRQRRAQDEALYEAREFLQAWPRIQRRPVPTMTVLATMVSEPDDANGSSGAADGYDWTRVDAAVLTAAREMTRMAETCGATVTGVPWRTLVSAGREQESGETEHSGDSRHGKGLAANGPRWSVNIPIDAEGQALEALPDDVEVRTFEARDELSIFIPGRNSMAKYATALSRLFTYPLDGAYVDVAQMRHLLHDEGIETAVALRELEETDGQG